jgi:hypothetical protein
MEWTHIPLLTLLLWFFRLVVVFSVLIECCRIASARARKRLQPTKEYSKPKVFSDFMEQWAQRQGVK